MSTPVAHVIRPVGAAARHFLARYRRSLADYRLFYDDVAEVGNPDQATHAFYYVPGISGSPGQLRLALPSLVRVFGPRIFAKGLNAADFSATRPIWEKYTVENTDRKLEQLRADLRVMLDRFEHFVVVCSSNGLYDFLAAASGFLPGELEQRTHLLWASCAPDRYEPTVWERLFFPLNGLLYGGHRWFAYPNHDALRFVNPEATSSFVWHDAHQLQRLRKADVESRFRSLSLEWDYVSTSQLGHIASYVTSRIMRPWDAPAEVLIAADDGYWQDASSAMVQNVVRRYVPRARCAVRPGTHVSVVSPGNLMELFVRVRSALAETRSCPRPVNPLAAAAP
jgi:hypothetical protein